MFIWRLNRDTRRFLILVATVMLGRFYKSPPMTRISVSLWSFGIAVILNGCATSQQHSAPSPKPEPTHVQCSGKQSPNKALCAHIREVGKHAPPLNESQVDILDAHGHVLASKSFKSADGEHGRSVAKSSWTPNSRFFVFSTASSGGHSPWHWQTYFYSAKSNSFKELDDTTGPIIKENFQITAPDVVHVRVQGTPSDPMDIETGTAKTVHLSSLP